MDTTTQEGHSNITKNAKYKIQKKKKYKKKKKEKKETKYDGLRAQDNMRMGLRPNKKQGEA